MQKKLTVMEFVDIFNHFIPSKTVTLVRRNGLLGLKAKKTSEETGNPTPNRKQGINIYISTDDDGVSFERLFFFLIQRKKRIHRHTGIIQLLRKKGKIGKKKNNMDLE